MSDSEDDLDAVLAVNLNRKVDHLVEEFGVTPQPNVFPIKRAGAMRTVVGEIASEHRNGELWILQQVIAQVRFDILKLIARDGLVPCRDFRVEVIVRGLQDGVPAEATGGREIRVPDYTQYVYAYQAERQMFL